MYVSTTNSKNADMIASSVGGLGTAVTQRPVADPAEGRALCRCWPRCRAEWPARGPRRPHPQWTREAEDEPATPATGHSWAGNAYCTLMIENGLLFNKKRFSYLLSHQRFDYLVVTFDISAFKITLTYWITGSISSQLLMRFLIINNTMGG